MNLTTLNRSLKHLKETGVAYLTVCFLGMQLVAFPLAAQEVGSATKEVITASGAPSGPSSRDALSLAVGKSKAYKFKNPVARISVGNPAVADVMLVNPREVYFLGKKTGSTNVTLWHTNNQTTNLDLFVGGDTDYIIDLISGLLPNAKNIKATAAGESIVLSGRVADAETVQKAMSLTEHATGKKVLNMLSTNDLEQVLLEVKVAEIDRSIADALGIQAQGTNFSFNPLGAAALGFSATASAAVGAGSGFTQTWFQANMQSGLVKILAEPNIMAISGQQGEFLSGGTVYLPVPQTGSAGGTVITLQAVPYGVGVKFTPTVLADGKINLKVAPQVSQVSSTGVTVTAGGQTQVIPQILSRSASTTVQLYDGQSFAIGGLISNNVNEVISAFPWLASLPVIGALFRSSSFQSNRSELMILVTPRIVKPMSGKPVLPTDSYVQPSQAEFFLGGKLEGAKPVETQPPTSITPSVGSSDGK
ncbi:type II and III secretion system protein family protein [Polynucleobacter sp. MWH-Braz-FAM2G]|uniref:type II and III secretion system protein family protein n=1 Tax=Polynucleobacter sp. MWH-Braz-FAM2G TaxID=1855883 RepID=UPI001BFD3993|nr:type II and III secretion system protein family protein [Polynucleobacter sp. MWH-Braz-FAM2G]QWD89948.1 type II and III secretion system protein family protein [Polynucleobacter sp. MWH-Braz-FAM2G]